MSLAKRPKESYVCPVTGEVWYNQEFSKHAEYQFSGYKVSPAMEAMFKDGFTALVGISIEKSGDPITPENAFYLGRYALLKQETVQKAYNIPDDKVSDYYFVPISEIDKLQEIYEGKSSES